MRFAKFIISSVALIAVLFAIVLSYEKVQDSGYVAGYNDGIAVTEKRLNELIELQAEKIRRLEKQGATSSGVYSTEVCGGNGVDVNGKHHSAGKTGCVRVFSDGRIEKY
jgi:hypothetical protein